MSSKIKIHLIAGARPNFMKVGPLYHELLKTDWANPILVHTGQHYSADMSDVFLRDLGLPAPNFHLHATGATHGAQTAAVLTKYESLCLSDHPDWVIVVGDINSTLAATLAAKKLNLPVAHLEAGLRSGDRTMPEEINRILVDSVADLLWTPSEDADANLWQEGVDKKQIMRVGNIMIDSYLMLKNRIDSANIFYKIGLEAASYAVVTMHRPVNVDTRERLSIVIDQLIRMSENLKIAFPVHPRTYARLESFNLLSRLNKANILLLKPQGYIEFMNLVTNSRLVVTDSGGIQEETSYLGIPCLTARESTERGITVSLGSNKLIAISDIADEVQSILNHSKTRADISIPLWDGHTAKRVVESLSQRIFKQ